MRCGLELWHAQSGDGCVEARIGITKRGKLVAVMAPAEERIELDELFAGMEAIRKRAKKMPVVTMKSLIEERRMLVDKTDVGADVGCGCWCIDLG